MSSNNIQQEMILPGEKIFIFAIKWTPESRELEEKMRNLNKKICYASLLGDSWISQNFKVRDIAGSCQPIPDQEFER